MFGSYEPNEKLVRFTRLDNSQSLLDGSGLFLLNYNKHEYEYMCFKCN